MFIVFGDCDRVSKIYKFYMQGNKVPESLGSKSSFDFKALKGLWPIPVVQFIVLFT